MRLEDLPAAEQAAVRAALGARARSARRVRRPAGAGNLPARPRGLVAGRPPSHTCHRCGATFGSYPAAERHVDGTHGAGRIAAVL